MFYICKTSSVDDVCEPVYLNYNNLFSHRGISWQSSVVNDVSKQSKYSNAQKRKEQKEYTAMTLVLSNVVNDSAERKAGKIKLWWVSSSCFQR